MAEDLTQEIFVKCYQKLDQYQKKSSLKSWIWRIASFQVINLQQKKTYRPITMKILENKSKQLFLLLLLREFS
ncbi:hypothetical protein IIE26_10455 [Cytobacillus oceanisediminis]|nr:hypothetical protein IIE26_10455 [Cytobacillus oceanisediminis]